MIMNVFNAFLIIIFFIFFIANAIKNHIKKNIQGGKFVGYFDHAL
jgi:hypothetical protein